MSATTFWETPVRPRASVYQLIELTTMKVLALERKEHLRVATPGELEELKRARASLSRLLRDLPL